MELPSRHYLLTPRHGLNSALSTQNRLANIDISIFAAILKVKLLVYVSAYARLRKVVSTYSSAHNDSHPAE
jgi:hypothetical protein